MRIREYRAGDQEAVIALVTACYREYGYTICLDRYDGDLLDVPGSYTAAGGVFWVLDNNGTITSTAALMPSNPGIVEIRRMYSYREVRGSGWAQTMLTRMIEFARTSGFATIEAWSDIIFERAHAFYRKEGFSTRGELREGHEFSAPYTEQRFYLNLG